MRCVGFYSQWDPTCIFFWLNLTILMFCQVLTTGVLNNSKPASVCVVLNGPPENNVLISASVFPYLLQPAPGTKGDLVVADASLSKFTIQPLLTLTFTLLNWYEKQCIKLVGAFDPEKTSDYSTPLDLKVRSFTTPICALVLCCAFLLV